MEWTLLITNEFETWWDDLSVGEQVSVAKIVELLRERGATLGYPHSSGIVSSRHSHMRALRIQHEGHPYRVLYAFDPNRDAILLIGGDKTGNNRWYEIFVPIADRMYDEHLADLEENTHGKEERVPGASSKATPGGSGGDRG